MSYGIYHWLERQLYCSLPKKNILFVFFTLPLAGIYLISARLRRWLYRRGFLSSVDLPGVTISIGNIGLGGTGKTPAVRFLATEIKKQGHAVAILSRGYGSDIRAGETLILLDGEIIFQSREFDRLPDEAMLLSHAVKGSPIVVGPDRIGAARVAIGVIGTPAFWILDDGFQHLQIKRAIDIVLINADSLTQLPAVPLPCGAWRESFSSLRWADYIVLTKAGTDVAQSLFKKKMRTLAEHYPERTFHFGQAISVFSPPVALGAEASYDQANKRINMLCGIANPEQFRKSLTDMGFVIAHIVSLPDHAWVTEEALNAFDKRLPIVMTGKDYWRQPVFFESRPDLLFMVAEFSLRLPDEILRTCLDLLKKS